MRTTIEHSFEIDSFEVTGELTFRVGAPDFDSNCPGDCVLESVYVTGVTDDYGSIRRSECPHFCEMLGDVLLRRHSNDAAILELAMELCP